MKKTLNHKKKQYKLGELIEFTNEAFPSDEFHDDIKNTFGIFLDGNDSTYYTVFSQVLGYSFAVVCEDEITKI
jgi:hypothetical protein